MIFEHHREAKQVEHTMPYASYEANKTCKKKKRFLSFWLFFVRRD